MCQSVCVECAPSQPGIWPCDLAEGPGSPRAGPKAASAEESPGSLFVLLEACLSREPQTAAVADSRVSEKTLDSKGALPSLRSASR